MSNIIGPSFLAFQVRDIEKSKTFYTDVAGLEVDPAGPDHAYVFKTNPIAFAIREPLVDLDEVQKLGWGVSPWFSAADIDGLREKLEANNVPILGDTKSGPFGRFFIFVDPNGYTITVHQAENNNG
jgi:predicted enzyme related to lactoylglutathione lyase